MSDLTDRLRAENAALKRDLQYARDGLTKGRTRMREDNERLAREAHTWSKAAESYAADAERFRWLAEHTVATGLARWVHPFQFLAEAVDARRKAASAADALDAQAKEIEALRAEVEALRLDAGRYRWLAGHCRSTAEHWGGRWSIVVEGPAPTKHDEEDAFDEAVDAAMAVQEKK